MTFSETKEFIDSISPGDLLSYISPHYYAVISSTSSPHYFTEAPSSEPNLVMVLSKGLFDFFPTSQVASYRSEGDSSSQPLIPVFSVTFLDGESVQEVFLCDIDGYCWIVESRWSTTYHPTITVTTSTKPKPLDLKNLNAEPHPKLVPMAPLNLVFRIAASMREKFELARKSDK